MKKKLLVTASTFPRWEGDTEPRFVLDLSIALLKYFDVTVLVPATPGAKDEEILEGVKVIRYHYFPIHKYETLAYPGAIVPRIREKKSRVLLVPFLMLGLWWKLFRILDDYDFVHAHWILPQGIVESMFRKKYIVTGHGGDVTSLNKGVIKKLKQKCLKDAEAVTVVSEALKKEVNKIAPNVHAEVLSMGCNTEKFGATYRIDNYFGQNEKKVVLFVGRLAEKKGVSYLIEAMKNIDAKLVIVGEGPLKNSLMEQAKNISNSILFLGAKSQMDLVKIYASADIFVAPSITAKDGDKEGLGLVLLEAMASGLPVIGSDSGGIPEIVIDGYNGYLVPEKDVKALESSILKLINDDKLRGKLAINGLKTAQSKDYKEIAENYYKIIMEKMK